MAPDSTIDETVAYRLILIDRDSSQILAVDAEDGDSLPCVHIPRWRRPVEELRNAVQTAWGLWIFILDFLPGEPAVLPCAVAEVLCPSTSTALKYIPLRHVKRSDVSDVQRDSLTALLSRQSPGPLSQIGWIGEAILWLESATQTKLGSMSEIEQANAGAHFSLVRFCMQDGRRYWLKATGKPNIHEFSITSFLSRHCEAYLPSLIGTKPEWNAWLMSGDANGFDEPPSDPTELLPFLTHAVEAMAHLQMETEGHKQDLLTSGAFNQNLQVISCRSKALFDYLAEAMDVQTTQKVPRLSSPRLFEIRAAFEAVCGRVQELHFPETILHGDLNIGNILVTEERCLFIDWSEAYLGCPLISLEHLLLLNRTASPDTRARINRELREQYRDTWSAVCDPATFDRAFVYMPLLAIASTLYGRGDWLESPQRNEPHRQSYARSLARHMDRAVREPEFREALRL